MTQQAEKGIVWAVYDPKEIQGNILRGYRLDQVRHIILEVSDRAAARRFLAAATSYGPENDGAAGKVPRITRASDWEEGADVRFNIGITFAGLRALGLAERDLASFPRDFAGGMASRAVKLSDFGESAPENWPAPFDEPKRVHIVATVYASKEHPYLLNVVQGQIEDAFTVLGVREGSNRTDGKVFFGYVDGISNPKFREVYDPDMVNADEPFDPLGTVLLKQPTHFEGLTFSVPTPEVLGENGAFNAFRVLRQDVVAFEAFLDRSADFLLTHPEGHLLLQPGKEWLVGEKRIERWAALREVVAAQMCGRWRNGTPYELSPDTPLPEKEVSRTNFDYSRSSPCPAGAHMRRVNPRGGPIVQRVSNYTRRLIRRGMPYGPEFDPAKPDNEERGLLGNFIGASYSGQFEAVMCDWLNLGSQDPNITGTNDPLLGANSQETSAFELTLPLGKIGETIRLTGLPRFVTTRGGAYTFLPSLPAIRYLSELTG